jgi:hypothetical protein
MMKFRYRLTMIIFCFLFALHYSRTRFNNSAARAADTRDFLNQSHRFRLHFLVQLQAWSKTVSVKRKRYHHRDDSIRHEAQRRVATERTQLEMDGGARAMHFQPAPSDLYRSYHP